MGDTKKITEEETEGQKEYDQARDAVYELLNECEEGEDARYLLFIAMLDAIEDDIDTKEIKEQIEKVRNEVCNEAYNITHKLKLDKCLLDFPQICLDIAHNYGHKVYPKDIIELLESRPTIENIDKFKKELEADLGIPLIIHI